ncbi:hypothetical protein EI555_004126, partial [Monodon monoceros]
FNMKTGTIFVLVAFIVRGLEVAYTHRPTFGAICVKECSEDRDCERGKECVEIGCARICVPQAKRGYCEIRCWKNWNCGARKWCMQKGCRKVCSSFAKGEICMEHCQRDGDCGAGEQCIQKGCSRVCSSVQDPGGFCVEECQGPWDCAIGSWCVNNGCGHMNGELELVHSGHQNRLEFVLKCAQGMNPVPWDKNAAAMVVDTFVKPLFEPLGDLWRKLVGSKEQEFLEGDIITFVFQEEDFIIRSDDN